MMSSLVDLYTRAIESAGPDELSRMFLAGIAFLVVAGVLLALGFFRVFARVMGIVGVLILMWLLWTLHQQTTVEHPTPEIRITRPRYPEDVRELIELALVVLPIASATVMSAVLAATWRHRRARVPARLSKGLQLYFHQQYDGALDELNQAVKDAPDQADPYYHRGRVYLAKGEPEQALADFDRALEYDPENVAAYVHRGRLRVEAGRLDDAMYDFERALALRPNDAETFLHRGVCLARKGSISGALVDFNRVLRLTNHTDFTGPASEYLRLYGGVAGDGLAAAAHPPTNGTPPALEGLEPPEAPLNWVI